MVGSLPLAIYVSALLSHVFVTWATGPFSSHVARNICTGSVRLAWFLLVIGTIGFVAGDSIIAT